MKTIILILILVISTNAITRSLDNKDLQRISEITGNLTIPCTSQYADVKLCEEFFNLTGMIYDGNSPQLHMQESGLLSFQNFLKLCLVLIAIAFTCSFSFDMFIHFGRYLIPLIELLFNKPFIYTTGLTISIAMMFVKMEYIESYSIRQLFIFDNMTPLFGCIILYPFVRMICGDYIRNSNVSTILCDLITISFWSASALFHYNKMIAIMVILMLFKLNGFIIGSLPGGYYSGFRGTSLRCLILSLLLNAIMIMTTLDFFPIYVTKYLALFDTGVYYWATSIGSVAIIILCDIDNIKTTYANNYRTSIFFTMQFVMLAYLTTLMYFSNVMHIPAYGGIAGIVMVLWILDIERAFLQNWHPGSTTFVLLTMLINIYLLKRYVGHYLIN